MIEILAAFLVSFATTLLIVHTQKLHKSVSGDFQFDGPQKFHTEIVPRIGGLGIGLGVITAITISYQLNHQKYEIFTLFACSLPVFLIGVSEDLTKKVPISSRFLCIALGSFLAAIFMNSQIRNIGIPVLNIPLSLPAVAIVFTVFAVTGVTNAYNIIDGFNGLSSMVGIIALLGIGYLGMKFGDMEIIFQSFIMIAAIFGFFIVNYPRGIIFLGDGGAYLIGFWVAILSILLINRHAEISPWCALMLNAYPVMETLFTIFRRKFHQGRNPGHPDGIHFHSLLFRRILNQKKLKSRFKLFDPNPKTSIYLWALSCMAVVPAILFYDSTKVLIMFNTLFAVSYIWIYKKIVTFKTPRWLHL